MNSLKGFALQVILFIVCSRRIDLHKSRSLFDLCMNTLNEIVLGLYCSYVMFYGLYCFYVRVF